MPPPHPTPSPWDALPADPAVPTATLHRGLHDAQTGDGGVPEEVQRPQEAEGGPGSHPSTSRSAPLCPHPTMAVSPSCRVPTPSRVPQPHPGALPSPPVPSQDVPVRLQPHRRALLCPVSPTPSLTASHCVTMAPPCVPRSPFGTSQCPTLSPAPSHPCPDAPHVPAQPCSGVTCLCCGVTLAMSQCHLAWFQSSLPSRVPQRCPGCPCAFPAVSPCHPPPLPPVPVPL